MMIETDFRRAFWFVLSFIVEKMRAVARHKCRKTLGAGAAAERRPAKPPPLSVTTAGRRERQAERPAKATPSA
jgi:hypothetical protein